LPELLRLKGKALASAPGRPIDEAQDYLRRSLELSRHQGAIGWELRAPADLAASFVNDGRTSDAPALLNPVLDRFLENDETADLKAARRLLTSLS
jgi:hypothetical protein